MPEVPPTLGLYTHTRTIGRRQAHTPSVAQAGAPPSVAGRLDRPDACAMANGAGETRGGAPELRHRAWTLSHSPRLISLLRRCTLSTRASSRPSVATTNQRQASGSGKSFNVENARNILNRFEAHASSQNTMNHKLAMRFRSQKALRWSASCAQALTGVRSRTAVSKQPQVTRPGTRRWLRSASLTPPPPSRTHPTRSPHAAIRPAHLQGAGMPQFDT